MKTRKDLKDEISNREKMLTELYAELDFFLVNDVESFLKADVELKNLKLFIH